MPYQNRTKLASEVETLGVQVNELRVRLVESRHPFLAGMVRSAEESLLIAMNTLRDVAVPDSEL